jgi:hypothetical protein
MYVGAKKVQRSNFPTPALLFTEPFQINPNPSPGLLKVSEIRMSEPQRENIWMEPTGDIVSVPSGRPQSANHR